MNPEPSLHADARDAITGILDRAGQGTAWAGDGAPCTLPRIAAVLLFLESAHHAHGWVPHESVARGLRILREHFAVFTADGGERMFYGTVAALHETGDLNVTALGYQLTTPGRQHALLLTVDHADTSALVAAATL